MYCKWKVFIAIACMNVSVHAQQKSVAITIDDVPNTTKYQKDHFSPVLLDKLDALKVPFTIFINEDKIYKTAFLDENKSLLEKWIENDRAIIGNHTYGHSGYSEAGFDRFVKDIEQGEVLTRHYAAKFNKEVSYFRFPFNDLGKDSISHIRIREYLGSKGYTIAPFTVESSDWMFDVVYRHYLEIGENEKAAAIGKQYVAATIELIKHFEVMSEALYNRPVKHIYLCHDNDLNADYLVEIIARLREENYEIISFEEALKDSIYEQEDFYFEEWGISWLYRWMASREERVDWMKREPDLTAIENACNELLKK